MSDPDRNALDRLIEILESARKRKKGYFNPVTPASAIHWLMGLRTGLTFVGLEWFPEDRQSPVERRGLEFRAAAWEDEEMESRGMGAEEIVDELLAIEIESWESARSRLNQVSVNPATQS